MTDCVRFMNDCLSLITFSKRQNMKPIKDNEMYLCYSRYCSIDNCVNKTIQRAYSFKLSFKLLICKDRSVKDHILKQ
jgi:hypothetical protein